MFVERFEDMSPTGRLRLIRQEDGDIIVVAVDDEGSQTSVEFCIPMSGGGQSSHTHAALRGLMLAMAKDELERRQLRSFADGREARTHTGPNDELKKLVVLDDECRKAEKEFQSLWSEGLVR